jgi:hypothetical protein
MKHELRWGSNSTVTSGRPRVRRRRELPDSDEEEDSDGDDSDDDSSGDDEKTEESGAEETGQDDSDSGIRKRTVQSEN